MSKPDDIPQDVWSVSAKVGQASCGCAPGRRRANGTSHANDCWGRVEAIARAIMAAKAEEREACAEAIRVANSTMPGIEVPLMRGDNLAIVLCGQFDDGEPNEDDTGWSPAATAGYQQTVSAIREHYAAAIRKRGEV